MDKDKDKKEIREEGKKLFSLSLSLCFVHPTRFSFFHATAPLSSVHFPFVYLGPLIALPVRQRFRLQTGPGERPGPQDRRSKKRSLVLSICFHRQFLIDRVSEPNPRTALPFFSCLVIMSPPFAFMFLIEHTPHSRTLALSSGPLALCPVVSGCSWPSFSFPFPWPPSPFVVVVAVVVLLLCWYLPACFLFSGYLPALTPKKSS